jgi:RNA polymerase sigma-70 factor (ECF subfamily)
LNEEALIKACLRGSAQHQRELYERYSGKMFAVCLRYARNSADAADMLQEGFVKVFTKLDQYHFQGSFEGWIRKIMVNTALRTYQRQRFDMEYSGFEVMPDQAVEPDAIARMSEAELLKVIAQLPDGYRVIFNLVAIEGYSHAEVAQTLGIQESTSRSQLTKARRWLCEQLETIK